ncbi:MAG: hypothetical protein LBC98_10590 [Prevotellaceae bacterium]|jgi:hypothetical protein|nr:hypothetical protein [Prevotellaceae bacterium]
MKRLFITFIALVFSAVSIANKTPKQGHPQIKDCKIVKEYGFVSETISLYGDVKIITDPKKLATFDVKIKKEIAALDVKVVKTIPRRCGEWRFVDSEKDADFTVSFVDESEDFTICFVDDNPGSAY